MYVCICNGVTERQVLEAASAGCTSVAELTMRTGCGAACGSCLETAGAMLAATAPAHEARFPLQVLQVSRAA